MADKKNVEKLPPVIELGGRSWTLRMTHNVMMQYSSITRVPLDQLENQVARYDYLVLLLWLMLHNQDGQLKREKFERWLEELGVKGVLTQLAEPISAAFAAAFPDPEELDEDEEAEAEGEGTETDPT